MPGNFEDRDIRIQRTNRALTDAMTKLLELRNFNQITVHDLCGQAEIGRATFYSHFQDKYDLLRYWLSKIKAAILSESGAYKDVEKKINDYVDNNGKIIRHLIEDANMETLELLCDFLLSVLDMNMMENRDISPKYAVLSRFCCGGIMNYLGWKAKNKSIFDLKMMDSYFYDILDVLHQWSGSHQGV